MIIADMLAEYEQSYFRHRDFVPAERCVTPSDKRLAIQEYELDPVAALMENVEQSRRDVQETSARLNRAKQDGLIDRDLYRAATKDEQKRWRVAFDVVTGDYQRAVSELKHWSEYVQWAREKQRATAADPRLPREREDDGDERREVQADQRTHYADQQP